jgi:hypothetical protein
LRPKLPPASEELRRVFGLIEQELLGWPAVRTRPMFGLKAFYRGTAIFALLPGKRALERPNAVGYKKGKKWELVDVNSTGDIGAALGKLGAAYELRGGTG